MASRSQWVTSRSILSNWRTNTESEGRRQVSLENVENPLAATPLLSGMGPESIGLGCFGMTLVVLSEQPRSAFELVSTAPLLVPELNESPEAIGFSCFGIELDDMSEGPFSQFQAESGAARDWWHNDRNILSNWLTRDQSESRSKVSLANVEESFSPSPLLMGLENGVFGIGVFGGELVSLSRFGRETFQNPDELLDVLATEDFDPIVTEPTVAMIALG